MAAAGAPAASPGLVLGSGDDASITERAGATAISVDAVVEGIHFRRDSFSLADVGAKGLAVSLSDLAAMGAEARDAYVQVGLPDGFGDAEALELADGLASVAARHRVAIAGGDLTRSPVLFLALTVVGVAESASALVTRSGAKPGDVLVVTGGLGGGAAAVELFRAPALANGLDPAVAAELRRRQLAPVPLLEAGRALAGAGVSAMIDVSDGLGGDARRIAEASSVKMTIEERAIPLATGVAEVAETAGIDPIRLALSGGDDYELLATIEPERVDAARAALEPLGLSLTEIGSVDRGVGVELSGSGGRAPGPPGYDHLARD